MAVAKRILALWAFRDEGLTGLGAVSSRLAGTSNITVNAWWPVIPGIRGTTPSNTFVTELLGLTCYPRETWQ